jgi:D-amino peptidase
LPGIAGVEVKHATGRFSAECLPPVVTAELIEQGTKSAVQKLRRKEARAPYRLSAPIQVSVEFKASDMADRAVAMPGAKRSDLKVSTTAPDMPAAYLGFEALVELARQP